MNDNERTSGLITPILWVGSLGILLSGIVAILYFKSFDTRYAPGYSEAAFKSLKIGDTEQKVLSLLGKPMSTDGTEPFFEWIYSAEKQRHFSNSGEGSGTTVRFDGAGKVANISGQRQTSANTSQSATGKTT
jgi:outer membrane protein assembly factor BamE (lipoprotein component of BamABCDE complex)